MDKCMWLQYPSSIEQVVETNESFDSCVVKICYTGANRNRSSISKAAIEDAIPSMYNCPIVCNYNVEDDTIGGHDVDIVKTNNGMRLINLTDAIGVVPFNANHYWETVIDGGVEHEYLCVEAILWKRSPAYSKIKRDGIVSQSMEITVKNGASVDGIYRIDKFIFTAFCLLGDDVEPCFESASLEVFSLHQYKQQFSLMMCDLEKHYSQVNTSIEDDINSQNLTKGGNASLNITELLTEFNLTIEDLDFKVEDFTIEQLREKFEAMKKPNVADDDSDNNDDDGENPTDETPENHPEDEPDDNPENDSEDGDDQGEGDTFALTGQQFLSELIDALCTESFNDPCWGEVCRYMYVDHSSEDNEVYCYDISDWKLYGFHYSMNGDNVVVDFNSKKRKKFSIVDFDEGSDAFNYKYAFETYGKHIIEFKNGELNKAVAEIEEKYNIATQTINDLRASVESLEKYKRDKQDEEHTSATEQIFEMFKELSGIEAFKELKDNCSEMSLEEIESKCYEIKGRNSSNSNFSMNKPGSVRIPVERNNGEDEPYGGAFIQYAPKRK